MNKRQQKLLDKLKRLGSLSLEEEAEAFSVSTMTIRRDIAMFEEQGIAVRSQGGAVSRVADSGQLLMEGNASDAQRRIARKTLELIPDACTLMLSTGRTTLEVARQLAVSGKRLAVVTNSLQIAAALFQTPVQVILTGGTLRADSLDLVGPVTEKNLDEYYIDILITGCDGAVADEGFFTKDLNLAAMERKSVEKSRKVIMVTESSKFNSPSFVKFAEPGNISTVVSDINLSDRDCACLQKSGIEVIRT
ncbi:MAG: DeoR/GlpR transcriptional regulator [Victivallales bacterium]|nr:DeoR/GlpR transcriptional regulator [Victivallales bacterium]